MTAAGHEQVAVVFDVGETLVDETRAWSEAARSAGVPALTLFGALGVLIEREVDHREVWKLLGLARPRLSGADIRAEDLYPDAVGCLQALAAAGARIGLAGNQPEGAEEALAGLGLPVSFIASSSGWGVEKPSQAFFDRVADVARLPPARVAYVGDRIDNDVLPAKAAGMFAVFLRRGPWGYAHAQRPQARLADARIDSLEELPAVIGRWRRSM